MKKILFVMQRLPDRLDEGAKFVSASDLTAASRLFDVDVLALADVEKISEVRSVLNDYGAVQEKIVFLSTASKSVSSKFLYRVLLYCFSFFIPTPYLVLRKLNFSFIFEYLKRVRSGEYSVIYIDGISLGYLPIVRLDGVGYVLRAHDVISETLERMSSNSGSSLSKLVYMLESWKTKRYEVGFWKRMDHILGLTRLNCDTIGDLCGNAKVIFSPPAFPHRGREITLNGSMDDKNINDDEFNILYVGNASYLPNAEGLMWFFRNVWGPFYSRKTNVRLVLVGKGTEKFSSNAGVVTHGYVEDLEIFYSKAQLTIAPLFSGSGIKLKVLDSAQRGVPVLTTSIGLEGIDFQDMISVLSSDDALGWIERLEYACNNLAELRDIASMAHQIFVENFSPDTATAAFAEIFKSV